MKNIDNNASDGEDSAPESISFDTGKLKTTEETLKVKEQVKKTGNFFNLYYK